MHVRFFVRVMCACLTIVDEDSLCAPRSDGLFVMFTSGRVHSISECVCVWVCVSVGLCLFRSGFLFPTVRVVVVVVYAGGVLTGAVHSSLFCVCLVGLNFGS